MANTVLHRAIRLFATVALACSGPALLAGCGDDDAIAGPEDTASAPDTPADNGGFVSPDAGDVAVPVDTADAGPDTAGPDTAGPDTVDTGADVTVDPCPGGPGCACTGDAVCTSGSCIETGKGLVCAASCAAAACPDGSVCVEGKPGGAKICAPKFANLCNPCLATSECQGPGSAEARCVDLGANGRFCASACAADKDCPASYACKDVNDVDGKNTKQCIPASGGACTCSPTAIAKKLQTICPGSAGTCPGVRTCQADGSLSACAPDKPSDETCNGKDDDCDGQTDEAMCDDSKVCTDDQCLGSSSGFACKNTANTAPCDADGSACTAADTCAAGACVAGTAKSCDDGQGCTVDACDAKTGTCSNVGQEGSSCSDSNACTTGDACTAGADGKFTCKSGLATVCDDQNPCTVDSCKADKGCTNLPDVFAEVPCYEGPAASKGKGVCKAGTATCSSEGKAGVCKNQVVPAAKDLCNGLDDDCDGSADPGCGIGGFQARFASTVIQGKGPTYTGRILVGGSTVAGEAAGTKKSVHFGYLYWIKALVGL